MRKKIATWALKLARWADPTAEYEVVQAPDYSSVGLRDAIQNGWFDSETAELAPDFRIVNTDTVVDVGCGDGGNAQFCAKFAHHVIAIDADRAKLAATEQRLRSGTKATFVVVLSDANPIPVDTAMADKIICTEVLEHVDDPARFLRELVRIGKPGATYLFSCPDALSESVMKRLAPRSSFERPNHIRVIGRDEFERMIADAGLIVKKHTFRGFYWAVRVALSWKCGVDLFHGRHLVLDHWARTWNAVLDLPHGQDCKDALDNAMPKSQDIVACKP